MVKVFVVKYKYFSVMEKGKSKNENEWEECIETWEGALPCQIALKSFKYPEYLILWHENGCNPKKFAFTLRLFYQLNT